MKDNISKIFYLIILSIIYNIVLTYSSFAIQINYVFYLLVFFFSFVFNKEKFIGLFLFVSIFEIFTKITNTSPSWEFSKIYLIIILVIYSYRFGINKQYFVFIIPLLILLRIIFTDYDDLQQMLSYLYPWVLFSFLFLINIKGLRFNEFSFYSVLFPIFLLVIYLLINKSSFSALDYGSGRFTNNSAVGFSGNQFTNSIGALLLLLSFNNSVYLKYTKQLTFIILIILLFYCFLTVARGGVLSFFISLSFYILFSGSFKKHFKSVFLYIILIFTLFVVVNVISDQSLMLRFLGSNDDIVLDDFTTGRSQIESGDYETFKNNILFGVGISLSGENNINFQVDSHNEFMRFLSEQGLFGFLSVIILIYCLYDLIKRSKIKILTISFAIYFLLYLYQGSTRVTSPFILLFFHPLFDFDYFIKSKNISFKIKNL